MKNAKLQTMSASELVHLFTDLALQQDLAVLAFDVKETNRLFWKLEEVEAELKSRPGDQRSALLPLFEHPNPQVRLKAAKATLAIAPVAARQVLESIAKMRYAFQQLEAGMSLSNLDAGIYKPN
jgi:cytochrome c oxidase assembly protein Cox11